MDYRRFLGSIFLVIFLLATHAVQDGNGDTVDDLKKQLVAEAKLFGLDIDASQIETTTSKGEGNDGTAAFVPLPVSNSVTDEEVAAGEVYTGFQCMDTELLKGCFKTRLTGVSEKGPSFELIDSEGRTRASATSHTDAQRARPCIHVWINGVYMGCFDVVIIIVKRVWPE